MNDEKINKKKEIVMINQGMLCEVQFQIKCERK